jgi:hypothetical protein
VRGRQTVRFCSFVIIACQTGPAVRGARRSKEGMRVTVRGFLPSARRHARASGKDQGYTRRAGKHQVLRVTAMMPHTALAAINNGEIKSIIELYTLSTPFPETSGTQTGAHQAEAGRKRSLPPSLKSAS